MAYTPLTDADLVAGKPTKEEIFTTIKSNQEDFDDRIALLQGTFKIDIFDIKFAGKIGQYNSAELSNFIPVFKAPSTGSMVSVVATLLSASTSGTLEFDIQKSTDNGINWNTVLTTDVVLSGTTVGSTSSAVSFITNGDEFNQNDLLRIVINTSQVDQGEFHISIYGELV